VRRKIFGPKRDEIIGQSKLHDEELRNLHAALNIIRMIESRKIRWAGHITGMQAKGNAYRILVEYSGERRLLGRPRRRWEDNIKIKLGGIRWGCMDWINVGQGTDQWRVFVNTVMNLRVL
jgi:hypothetical protein